MIRKYIVDQKYQQHKSISGDSETVSVFKTNQLNANNLANDG